MKKVIWAALLIAVIVGVVTISVWRRHAARQMPAALREEVYTLIDTDTLELFEMTRGELWAQATGSGQNIFKNPKTGKDTLRVAMPCRSCGKLMPSPVWPETSAVCPHCGASLP